MRYFLSLLFLLFPLLAAAQISTVSPSVPVTPPARGIRAVWLCTYSGLDWPGRHYARTEAEARNQRSRLSRIFDLGTVLSPAHPV